MRTPFDRGPWSVIRQPFTVYRSSHRSEGLKGLDVGASYFVDISCAWLWVDGLKKLDVGGSYFCILSCACPWVDSLK